MVCRMPSVAARGTGMRAMAEAVEQMLQRVGGGTRIISHGLTAIRSSTANAAPARIPSLVYGHYDVQPVGHLDRLVSWTISPLA